MPLRTVAAGEPVTPAMIACAPDALMRSICAVTLMSVGLRRDGVAGRGLARRLLRG